MVVGVCRSPPNRLGGRDAAEGSAPNLLCMTGMKIKSLPVPVAHARNNFSDVVADAQRGKRIRLTRHGKPVSWIIGAEDRAVLDQAHRGKLPRARRSSGR